MFFSRKTPEQRFWDWFSKNDARLYDFELDQERTFDALAKELNRVSPDLTFEFGPKQDGVREFVISASGIKAAFPAVEALAGAAPPLQRWRITKFRPRRHPVMEISMGEVTVKPQEVDCCVLSNGQELGLYLFFRGYSASPQETWGQLGYLLLDEALGEYDVEMKVSLIKFFPFEEHADADRFPFTELAERFDAHFADLLQ